MNVRRALTMLVVAVGLGAGPSTMGLAQEAPRPKDDALDSLLEKLSDPSDGADKKDGPSPPAKKEGREARKSADAARPKATGGAQRPGTAEAKGDDGKVKKPEGSSPLEGKDQ